MKLMDLIRQNKGLILVMIGAPLLAIMIVIVMQTVSQAAQDRDDRAQDQAIVQVSEENKDIRDGLEKANEQIKKLGGTPVPVPPSQPLPTPSSQQTVIIQGRAPTIDEIKLAVAAFCRDTSECRGPSGRPGASGKPGSNGQDGQPGEDGLNVTVAQAAAAVATYCNANGQCRGERGPQGEDGDQGPGPSDEQILAGLTAYCADGACRGEQGDRGPGPTEEEIAAEVAKYCADDRCRGEKGEPGEDSTVAGPQGEQGEPGRGIADNGMKCVDGRWQITYTDGETEDGGRCWPWPFEPNR